MKKSLLTLSALLCVVMQGLWAQEPTPSTVAASLASQHKKAFTSSMAARLRLSEIKTELAHVLSSVRNHEL